MNKNIQPDWISLHQFEYTGAGKIRGRHRSNDGEFFKFHIHSQDDALNADESSESETSNSSESEGWSSDSLDEDCPDTEYYPTPLAILERKPGTTIEKDTNLKKGDRVEVFYEGDGLGWMRGEIYRFFHKDNAWCINFDNGRDLMVPFWPMYWRWAKADGKNPTPIN